MRNNATRESEVRLSKSLVASIKVWVEPTDLEWDGDGDLAEGSEGWDIAVEASLETSGQTFRGYASVGGNWVSPNNFGQAYIEDEVVNITQEAISALKAEIKRVASGEDIKRAQKRAKVASNVAKRIGG